MDDDLGSPLAIYKVKKDKWGRPEEVQKVLLDPKQGVIIDSNKQGDMYKPEFPSRRRKRGVKDDADPTMHKPEIPVKDGDVYPNQPVPPAKDDGKAGTESSPVENVPHES